MPNHLKLIWFFNLKPMYLGRRVERDMFLALPVASRYLS